MRTRINAVLLCLAVLAVGASSASARPSVYRYEAKIQILYQECLNRAMRAFQVNGWSGVQQGPAFVLAIRGIETGIITCNEVPGVSVINVFVASDDQNPNAVEPSARQLWQAMSVPAEVRSTGPTAGGQTQQWRIFCCNNAYSGTMTLNARQEGTIVYFSGTISSEFNGGNVSGSYDVNTLQVSFRREIGSPNNVQNYYGTISTQGGIRMSGTWNGAYSGSAPPDWHAELISSQ